MVSLKIGIAIWSLNRKMEMILVIQLESIFMIYKVEVLLNAR